MKKFTVNCTFGGANGNFTVFIGKPESGHHPLHFQSDWLSKERGGAIPPKVMESLAKLKEISDKNNVSFEQLCEYAMQAASIEDKSSAEDAAKVQPTTPESGPAKT